MIKGGVSGTYKKFAPIIAISPKSERPKNAAINKIIAIPSPAKRAFTTIYHSYSS